jgi:hypothetical protein
VVVLALAALVAVARLFPVRPPTAACREDGGALADVDRHGFVSYGTDTSALRPADVHANLAMLEKNNRAFAGAIAETLGAQHRIFPAYDACHGRMLYVVDDVDIAGATEARAADRWRWLRTTPMAQPPLERALR